MWADDVFVEVAVSGVPMCHSAGMNIMGGILDRQNAFSAMLKAQTEMNLVKAGETSQGRRLRMIGERISVLETHWAKEVIEIRERDEAFAIELAPQ